VSQQRVKQSFGPGGLTKSALGERGVVGQLGEIAHAHCLKIAPKTGGGVPVGPGRGVVAGGGTGFAQPEVDLALVGEEVAGLAEVFRRGEGEGKFGPGRGGIAVGEGCAAQ